MEAINDTQQVHTPVSFEIEDVKNTQGQAANPPIKQRLEQKAQESLSTKEQLTHEKIDEKLVRAGERKAQVISNQVSQNREQHDKILICKERISSIERAQGQKVIQDLGQRQLTAEANRQNRLLNIVDRAKRYNARVIQTRERRTS